MNKNAEKIFNVAFCSIGVTAIGFCIYGATHVPKPIAIESVEYPPMVVIESPTTGIPEEEIQEDPNEEEKSNDAVYASIGTPKESEVFSYSFTRFCESVYEEAGGNSDDLIRAVATCAVNSVRKEGCRYNFEEIIDLYQWSAPKGNCSQRVIDICFDVLIRGNVYEGVGNATMFYNPTVRGENYDHEVQKYVTTIENVRFFEKVK